MKFSKPRNRKPMEQYALKMLTNAQLIVRGFNYCPFNLDESCFDDFEDDGVRSPNDIALDDIALVQNGSSIRPLYDSGHDHNDSFDSLNVYHPFDFPPLTRSLFQSNLNCGVTTESDEERWSMDSSNPLTNISDQTVERVYLEVEDGSVLNMDVNEFDDNELVPQFSPKCASTPLSASRWNNFSGFDGLLLDDSLPLFDIDEPTGRNFVENFIEPSMPTLRFNDEDENKTSRKRKRAKDETTKENGPKKGKIHEIRRNSKVASKPHCEYCKDNGELPAIYSHHTLVDAKGRTLCPVLRQIVCKICGADGDDAHQPKQCPMSHREKKSRCFERTLRVVQRTLKHFKI